MTECNGSSEELLADFAENRTESAFRELVHRHLALVLSTALRVANGDQHLAEDIAQIVFTDLARKAPRLSSGTIIAGWLHQHTWFTACKTIRSERRRAAREQHAAAMTPIDSNDSVPVSIEPILDDRA